MVFSSILFLFRFLPSMLVVYYCTPRRFRNAVLFGGSLVFYAWGEPVYIVLILFSTLVAYCAGLRLSYYQKRENKRGQICSLTIACVVSLLLLGFFKYADFFLRMAGYMAGVEMPQLNLPLPIGISFYTFQTMSYVIDVYRKEVKVQKNFVTFGTYVALFPQLIAGPIIRYQTVEEQMVKRKETIDLFSKGIVRFMIGLGKKVLIANPIGDLFREIAGMGAADLTTVSAWLGVIAFTLQIYFDFSGYSDMAIGLGSMFGFSFPENFRHPYESRSITEFWRRWHISLGSFFRDYVYIPLGGSRKGLGRTILNLFVVWALTGLWHGASWNFVLWGLYFFIFIALERLFLNKVFARLPGFVSHIYLLIVVYFGWILFRFKNMALIGVVLKGMFCQNGNPWTTFEANTTLLNYIFFLAIAVIAVTPVVHNIGRAISVASGRSAAWFRVNSVVQVAMPLVLLLISTMSLVGNSYNPFLYFQF